MRGLYFLTKMKRTLKARRLAGPFLLDTTSSAVVARVCRGRRSMRRVSHGWKWKAAAVLLLGGCASAAHGGPGGAGETAASRLAH